VFGQGWDLFSVWPVQYFIINLSADSVSVKWLKVSGDTGRAVLKTQETFFVEDAARFPADTLRGGYLWGNGVRFSPSASPNYGDSSAFVWSDRRYQVIIGGQVFWRTDHGWGGGGYGESFWVVNRLDVPLTFYYSSKCSLGVKDSVKISVGERVNIRASDTSNVLACDSLGVQRYSDRLGVVGRFTFKNRVIFIDGSFPHKSYAFKNLWLKADGNKAFHFKSVFGGDSSLSGFGWNLARFVDSADGLRLDSVGAYSGPALNSAWNRVWMVSWTAPAAAEQAPLLCTSVQARASRWFGVDGRVVAGRPARGIYFMWDGRAVLAKKIVW
jgi:hypothetical protein